MSDTKIIIITPSYMLTDAMDLAHCLVEHDEELSIAPQFTTDKDLADEANVNPYITDNLYYMPVEEVNLAYKNKAILFIETKEYVSTGITIDSMYNNSIFCISFNNFNNITDHVLLNQDVLVVWLDTHYHKEGNKNALKEIPYIEERLEYIPYMYFLDENLDEMAKTIISYIDADTETRTKILEENS